MKIVFGHQIFSVQKYGGISRYFYELANQINNTSRNNIGSIHIKDRKKFGQSQPLGLGDVEFKMLFNFLKKINYKKELVLETYQDNKIN